MKRNIKYIGLDADDTLWINEPLFHIAEKKLAKILSTYINPENIVNEQYKTESSNIKLFGYGVKGFTLSMIETAHRLTDGKISSEDIVKIISLGKEILTAPVQLLDDVETVVKQLSQNYKLVVATKGDLLDQESKLKRSGIEKYFHHIEVMSEKNEEAYLSLLSHLEIKPEEFVMIGNSLKSDIIPPVKIGIEAIHIPFKTTWQHESVTDKDLQGLTYTTVNSFKDLLNFFDQE